MSLMTAFFLLFVFFKEAPISGSCLSDLCTANDKEGVSGTKTVDGEEAHLLSDAHQAKRK